MTSRRGDVRLNRAALGGLRSRLPHAHSSHPVRPPRSRRGFSGIDRRHGRLCRACLGARGARPRGGGAAARGGACLHAPVFPRSGAARRRSSARGGARAGGRARDGRGGGGGARFPRRISRADWDFHVALRLPREPLPRERARGQGDPPRGARASGLRPARHRRERGVHNRDPRALRRPRGKGGRAPGGGDCGAPDREPARARVGGRARGAFRHDQVRKPLRALPPARCALRD